MPDFRQVLECGGTFALKAWLDLAWIPTTTEYTLSKKYQPMIPPSPTHSSSSRDTSITVIHDELSPSEQQHDLESNNNNKLKDQLSEKDFDQEKKLEVIPSGEEEEGIIWVHWDSPDE